MKIKQKPKTKTPNMYRFLSFFLCGVTRNVLYALCQGPKLSDTYSSSYCEKIALNSIERRVFFLNVLGRQMP